MTASTTNANLFNVIQKLRDKGIDVNNVTRAVTAAEDFETDQAGYERALFEITGDLTHTGFELQAKMYFINFVRDAVTQYAKTDDIALQQAIRTAQKGTESYFDVFSSRVPAGKRVEWKMGHRDEVKAMVAKHKEEYVRPVSKQARAIDIVKANPTASSRELQAMFVDQLKLTVNGAATYLYNIKKGIKAGTM